MMKAYNKKAGFQNFSQSAAGEVRKKLLKKYRFEKALGLTVETKDQNYFPEGSKVHV